MEELVQGGQTALSNSGASFYGVYMQEETHLLWQEITEWRVHSTATPTMQTRLPT